MERPKAFEVILSNKVNLKIDEDEVQKVLEGILSGSSVIVRQGLFNPSFFIAIREDRERIKEYLQLAEDIHQKNLQAEKYGAGKVQKIPGFEKLENIFDGIKLLN